MVARVKALVAAMPEGRRRAFKLGSGLLVGAALGYAYYALIGCNTGTCPITADPWISTAYGAGLGALATWS